MTIQQTTTALLRRPAGRTRTVDVRPAPLRFLFVGTGIDHGWGAASRRPAPTHDLEHGIQAITGARCVVEPMGDGAGGGSAALDRLRQQPQGHDGAVVAMGAADALGLTPVAEWGAQLVGLVTSVQSALPAGAPVLLVGVPAVHVPKRVRTLNPIALRHAARLDRVARRLADVRPEVRYLPAPRLSALVGRRPGPEVAAAYTLPLAAALASAMRAAGPVPAPYHPDRFDVRTVLDAEHSGAPSGGLGALTRRIADEFHVREAAISLFDGRVRGRISSTGTASTTSFPLTYCETVTCTDEPLVVPDAQQDPRFTAVRALHAGHGTFYAGVPLHAEDGTAIGALCLLDDSSRPEGSVDLERLREFAHQAELAMRRTGADRWERERAS